MQKQHLAGLWEVPKQFLSSGLWPENHRILLEVAGPSKNVRHSACVKIYIMQALCALL